MELEFMKDLIKKNLVAIIAILIACLSIVGSIIYVKNNTKLCEECKCDEKIVEAKETTSIDNSKIKVDVKGSVKKPGVYELEKDSNIQDAINASGGITASGSTKNINLAKKLSDQMVIYVFSKTELKKREQANEVVCEIPKCECETVEVVECPSINQPATESPKDDKDKEEDTNQDASHKGKISINNGSLEDLMSLDGIGESKAQAIIEYRTQNGPFSKLEDLMNVSGIGEKAFEKIKDNITL